MSRLPVISMIGLVLEGVRDSLASGFPARQVTRTMLDFARRRPEDLQAGVWTVLADGQGEIRQAEEYVRVLLVGQIQVPERAAGEDLEEMELRMIDEIKALRRAASVRVDILDISQSRQLEAPYGWVAARLRIGPLDLTPPLDEGELSPFALFHADWDIHPYSSREQQQAWSEEDYSGATPDAQDDVVLEQE